MSRKAKPCPSPEVEFCLRRNYSSRSGLGIACSINYLMLSKQGEIIAMDASGLIFLAIFLIGGIFNLFIAKVKRRHLFFWFLIGFFLPVISSVIMLCLPPG